MQNSLLTAIALIIMTVQSGQAQEISIFNGKDLTGWEGLKQYWSVKDGAIVGKSTERNANTRNTFLVWKGGDVSDFEFSCKYKLEANNPEGLANSGVQFRAAMEDAKNFFLVGYQAELDPGTNHPAKLPPVSTINGCLTDDPPGHPLAMIGQKTIVSPGGRRQPTNTRQVGSLGSSAEMTRIYKAKDWNELRIVALGNHIQIFINGRQTAEAIDEGNRYTTGLLGLQLQDPKKPKVVQFKDLKLKRLQAGQPAFTCTPSSAPSIPGSLPSDLTASAMDTLTKQAPNAIEWALAPLDQAVPVDVRQNLTFLSEDVKTETQDNLKLSATRDAGVKLCEAIIGVLDERKLTRAKAGFRAVEAQARTG